MLKSMRAQLVFCILLGVVVGLVLVSTLAWTAAISAPRGIFWGMRSRAAFEIGLFLWGAIVVYGLGAGVIALAALLSAYGLGIAPTVRSAALFIASVLFTLYVLVPLAEQTPIEPAFYRRWWAYGLEFDLLASALLAIALRADSDEDAQCRRQKARYCRSTDRCIPGARTTESQAPSDTPNAQ